MTNYERLKASVEGRLRFASEDQVLCQLRAELAHISVHREATNKGERQRRKMVAAYRTLIIEIGGEEAIRDYFGEEDKRHRRSSGIFSLHDDEKRALKEELRKERSKVTCSECRGTGIEIEQGPYHGSRGQCWKCRGEGRIFP